MLAIAPPLLASPCTAPWTWVPAARERMASSDGYITPFPSASSAAPA